MDNTLVYMWKPLNVIFPTQELLLLSLNPDYYYAASELLKPNNFVFKC